MSDVTPEVLARLRRVRPADASDALDSLGYVDTFAMDVAMRPLAGGQQMVGLAQTFQLVPADRVPARMSYDDYAGRLRELADGWNLWGARTPSVSARAAVGDHDAVLDWLTLLVGIALASLRSRRALVAENLLLRQQLLVAVRVHPQPQIRRRDRVFWVVARRPCAGWRRHLVLVQPKTVLRWHRQGWRLVWWWRSRRPTGRPRVPPEVRGPIRRLSEENRLWGTERLRGELRTLGLAVGNGSIRRYRWRPAPRPPSQTWGTFLRNHAHAIWAADLLTVQTLTFRTLYVLFFISHGRRELIHAAVTAHPTSAWVWRQVVEATAWGHQPTYLLRDRDRSYGGDLAARAKAVGIQTLLTPFRAPKANALAERVVRTLRNECLAHLLILNEQHLRVVLAEYVAYSNADRPHRSLALAPPAPASRSPVPTGAISSRPVLGGLYHVYHRAA